MLLNTRKIHFIYVHACQVNFLHTQTIFWRSVIFAVKKRYFLFFTVWLSFEDISHVLNSACFIFTTKVTDNNGFEMNYFISWLKITLKLYNFRYIFPFVINTKHHFWKFGYFSNSTVRTRHKITVPKISTMRLRTLLYYIISLCIIFLSRRSNDLCLGCSGISLMEPYAHGVMSHTCDVSLARYNINIFCALHISKKRKNIKHLLMNMGEI